MLLRKCASLCVFGSLTDFCKETYVTISRKEGDIGQIRGFLDVLSLKIAKTLELFSQNRRFEIIAGHARGGLGEVLLAQDRQLNRKVATEHDLAQLFNAFLQWQYVGLAGAVAMDA